MRSRLLWFGLLVLIAAMAALIVADISWWLMIPVGVLVAVYGWWSFPGRGGGTTHAVATQLAEVDSRGRVIIYWRPGCTYCSALRRRLGSARDEALWVNIWTDPEAAAYVRSVNDGNETVPTVVIEGRAHTNPDAGLVRRHLATAA
ncbi:glutaredoxin domain-containing protein [Ruania rhizosphaerae]|uniref:glutaredoxin domain-containing protein n=1 Tax=Ruania rhizosphaerae TaxID=1840413 RepID=UPI001F3DBC1D|nr:glutaredoxin domain-containing protein [Ruania rhizosphaerae]